MPYNSEVAYEGRFVIPQGREGTSFSPRSVRSGYAFLTDLGLWYQGCYTWKATLWGDFWDFWTSKSPLSLGMRFGNKGIS